MPRFRSGRRRRACHHEAAHAYVRWYFGFGIDRVVVLTVDEVLAGRRIRTSRGNFVGCEGMALGPDILELPYGPRVSGLGAHDQEAEDKWRNYRRDVALIDCYAGFLAEARYARVSAVAAALAGGERDLSQFEAIMGAWFPRTEGGGERVGYEALEVRIAMWAGAIVGSVPGRAAIRALADALQVRGSLRGKRVAELCRRAYGGRECPFDAWSGLWPPNIGQLRGGFIPGPREG